MKRIKAVSIIISLILMACALCSGCGANPEKIATDFVENLWDGKISKCADLVHDDLLDSYDCTRKEFKQYLNEAYRDTMDLYDSFKLIKVEVEESYEDSYIRFDDAWSALIKYTYSYRDANTKERITDCDSVWIMIYDGKVVDF